MTRSRVIGVLGALALAAAVPAAAQTASGATALTAPSATAPLRLTLADALSRAATGNKTLVAARLRQAVDAAGVDVAAERPNPDFTYEGSKETPHQAFGVSVPVETAGKRARRIALARASAEVTAASIAQITLDVNAEVRRAYFTLAAASARAVIADDIVALATRASDAAAARVAAGDAPRLEQLQAELERSAAENDASRARADVVSARARLNTLIGLPPAAEVTAADDIMDAGAKAPAYAIAGAEAPAYATTVGRGFSPGPPAAGAKAPAYTAAGAEAPADAIAASVDLAVIDREIAAEVARRNLAQSFTVPDLTAGAALTYDAPDEFRFGWRVSGTVTVPLFTRHRAGVALEDAALVALRAERDALVADLAGRVREAAARGSAAADALRRFTADILPRSIEIEAMAEDSYRSGQTGLAALLQTVQSARTLRLESVQAALDLQLALADLERATGASIK